VISSRTKLAKVVGWLGICIGLTVAIVVPAQYLLVTHSKLDHELSLLLDLKAARLAKYIYEHQELWQHQAIRLADLTEIPQAQPIAAQQRIMDATGELVLENGEMPAFPRVRGSRPIIVAGLRVATIDLSVSLRPLLAATALVSVFSCLLGIAVFLVIRVVPQRIIDRTISELQATQARLSATIEAIPIEFMEYNRDGRLTLINSAARLSQGWDSSSIGKTQLELLKQALARQRILHPDQDWDGWMTERLAGLGRTGSYELTRPTGESGRFFVKDMPGGGQVILRVDITESRQRAAELASTHDRYRMLFDANPYPMAVIVVETDRFIAVNDAAVAQYGYSRDEFLAMTSDELYLPEDIPALKDARQRRGPRGAIRVVQGLRHRKKDGSVFEVEMSVRPFSFDGVPAMLVMGQDITERNRAEKARLLSEEQLRQSQKMEAVGQLTGGIAHDFNNILMVILANADALQEEVHDGGVLHRLDEIAKAAERAADLTRQLLAFSRKQSLNPKRTNINTLVAGTGALLRRSLGEHIEIQSVLAEPLWPTSVDQAQLESALINLCVNARDAMPGGGKLLIETRNVTLDAGYVALNPDASAGDFVVMAVTDSGSGIAPDTLTKIFDPFFTTKELGKGTGLGLSMVYGFIKQSRGHIKVTSKVGRGTCITLHLPRDESVQEETGVPQKPSLIGGQERILVVEDEDQVRASVVQQLESLGYEVEQAANGPAGLQSCEATTEPYDLLLTDMMMPGLSGKDLADAVARRWPATKIVFMSGYAKDGIVHDGRVETGILLLSKPFRKKDLAQIVRQALGAAKSVPAAAS
jgi:PAS domain S-box-containing protein